jgi:hypothetical protein
MTTKTERIRALNDVLRTTGIGGRILITRGIASLPPTEGEAIMHAVQTFNDFTADNDPHGEHDCAVLTAAGQQIIFKIDYYDREMTYLSPDPSDSRQTCRVLTVMLSSEY